MENDPFRLRHIVECFDADTGDQAVANALLQGIGLDRAALQPPSKVRTGYEPLFLDLACEELRDPLFAARAGAALKDGTNLNSYIAKHSKTLRKAIDNSSRYYTTFDPAYRYAIAASGNAASFSLTCTDPDYFPRHRYLEFLAFAALARSRTLTGKNVAALELRFSHEIAGPAKPYEMLASCPVRFGAEQTEVLLPLWVLDLEIPTYDPSLRTHLMEYGDRLLRETPARKQTLSQQVKAILAQGLPARVAGADDVAAQLGMSRRTFARRLGEENVSFRGLVDDMRCDLARVYLTEGFSLAEIAFSLGYSDQAAFSTAFKRWTGKSPGSWRDGGS